MWPYGMWHMLLGIKSCMKPLTGATCIDVLISNKHLMEKIDIYKA